MQMDPKLHRLQHPSTHFFIMGSKPSEGNTEHKDKGVKKKMTRLKQVWRRVLKRLMPDIHASLIYLINDATYQFYNH